jgi:hypothetical protein
MIGTIPGSGERLDVNDIKAGAPDSDSIVVGTLLSTNHVVIAADSDVGNGNVNESHAFVGVDNGNLDAHESLTFTYFDANDDQIFFEGLRIGTKSASGGFYEWTAILADGVTPIYGPTGGEFVAKNGTLTVDPADYGLLSSITVTKVSGSATKIGLGNIEILNPPADVDLSFTARLTDGDNDWVDRSFTVSIDGNNDGSITSPITAAFADLDPHYLAPVHDWLVM